MDSCIYYGAGSYNYPAYPLELEISHLRSSVFGLCRAFMEGRKLDYDARVGERLEIVENLHKEASSLDLPENDKDIYLHFLQETRKLLLALADHQKSLPAQNL